MDFLNRGLKQIADLFETMTPAARVTTGLLLAVLIVSFVYLFRQNVEGGGEYLFDGSRLSGPEISEMQGVFAEAGLQHGVREGYQIRVPKGEGWKYMAALMAAGVMPENSGTAYDKALKGSSLLDSRPVVALRERIASERSLERLLRNLNGVLSATVRIHERDNGSFPRTKVRTAVAAVKADNGKHLDRALINTIRDIVAGSAGVDRENVTVADFNSSLSHRGSGKDGIPLADEDPHAAREQLYEDNLKRKIENLLANYSGALIEVRAVLARDYVNREETVTHEGQPVTIERTSSTRIDTSTTSANGGRPGTIPNGLGNQAQQVSTVATNDNKSEETTDATKSVAGTTFKTIYKTGFKPERVTASIRIPRSTWRTIWLAENPTADGEDPVEPDAAQLQVVEEDEIKAIKESVTALLPAPEPGDDPYPLVTVEPYTATPIAEPEVPGIAANAGNWFASNWQTIALFGAAIFSVFFLRGMVQSNTPAPSRASTPSDRQQTSTADGLDDDEMDETDVGNSLREKGHHTGRSLRDELTELVHDDPDAAASVLANWIGEAA